MKPSALATALTNLIPRQMPLHIWGPPGVGKSQILAQAASQLGLSVLDVRAVLLDPVDLRGLPRLDNGRTTWAVPDFLPRDGEGVLFLDELTSAPQLVQAACYQLVLDRRLAEYRLPDGWSVIAAGNRAADRGVHFAMPTPLRNRFIHLDLEVDVDDWCNWALGAGVRPEVLAFVRFRPALLHQSGERDANAWPTPRSWEFASRVLDACSNSPLEHDLLRGAVGDGAAAELSGFLRMFRDLPSIDEILLNPDRTPVPDQPASMYAVATGIATRLNDRTIGRGLTYLNRMPPEFCVLAVRDAARRDPQVTKTKEFVGFASRHAEVLY
jgi:hypothetical protein